MSFLIASMMFASINSHEPDPQIALQIAQRECVLRGLVGSEVHGLSNPGTDDRDELGVCVEPPAYVLGLRGFEHCVARTQPEGMPSGPGDIDLTVYGLRKFMRLAMKGSPTVLLLFFIAGENLLERTDIGEGLQQLVPAVLSAHTGRAFLGYLEAQAKHLAESKPREREQSQLHRYDTKYAMHALRIGYQGLELLERGTISLPMAEPVRSQLRDVRAGTPALAEVVGEIQAVSERLQRAATAAALPPEPDRARIDEFLGDAYLAHWRGAAERTASGPATMGDGA